MSLHASLAVQLGDFLLDVSFTAEAGETVAILGPNGSGKSTALRCLAGLTPIDRGRIELDGRVLDDTDTFVAAEQRGIGVVFQSYALFEHLTARDNVAFGLRATGTARGDARQAADLLLDRFELGSFAEAKPARLSGGQQQRVALARALAIEPRMLLLDEPLAALDVTTRRQVRRELRGHLNDVAGVRIIVTHDPLDVYALADRLVILEAGQVAQQGTIADITAHPRSQYVADLVGTNLVSGEAIDGFLLTEDGVDIAVSTAVSGPAFATIRPQSITLATVTSETSARNTFSGTVDDIDRLGDRSRVGIAGALSLVAEITTASLDQLALRPGDPVFATVKATDIDVYPA